MLKAFKVHWLYVVHKSREFYLRGNFILIYLNIKKNVNSWQLADGYSAPDPGLGPRQPTPSQQQTN